MGAIGPKGKISRSRRGSRRAQSWQISAATLTKCVKCGGLILTHRACRNCGTYNKRTVLAVEE